ncbi:hypothetical protein JI506_15255, partial [Listeria monocytogenes]|nr:hypothetical protein [Listeria monocytogenes]
MTNKLGKRAGKITGSRSGMRIVIEVRRDISASVIVNNLFKMTALQTTFGINMLALVD